MVSNTTGSLDLGVLVFSYVEEAVRPLTLRFLLVTMHFIRLHRNEKNYTSEHVSSPIQLHTP